MSAWAISLLLAALIGVSETWVDRSMPTRAEPPPQAATAETETDPGTVVETVPPSPSLHMPTGFQVLSPGRGLRLEANHLRFARLRTLALGLDEVNEAGRHLGQTPPGHDPLDAMPKSWRSRFVPKILDFGEMRTGASQMYDPFASDGVELALVVFDAPGQGARTALLQRGDLQVLMKLSQGEGLLWVTDARGEPVRGAAVEVRQGSSRRFRATTNREGIAMLPSQKKLRLPYREGLEWQDDYYRPLMAYAKKQQAIAFTSQAWTTGIEPWEFDIPMHYYYGEGSLVGSVNPERGIYRPGHPVHLVGAVRKREPNGRLSVPRQTVLVRILDPDYTSIASERVTLTEFGTFRLDTELPLTARLGRYSVEATVGDTTLHSQFRVAKYRPTRFEVKVKEVEPVVLHASQQIEVETSASYLYGAKLEKAEIAYDLSLRPSRIRDSEGFTAGAASEHHETVPLESAKGVVVDGHHRLEIHLDEARALFPETQELELLVQASVTDPAGDTITGHRTIQLTRTPHVVLLKNQNWVVDTKHGWDVELKSRGPETILGDPVTIQLHRRQWVSHANQNDSGMLYDGRYEVALVSTQTLRATHDVQRIHFRLEQGGTYLLRASSGDGTAYAEVDVWAYGRDSYGRFDNQPRMGVHSDKPAYEPGETARLLVESPYETALALVTLEQEGVLSAHTERLNGAGGELSVRIGERHLPNVFASVSVVPRTSGAYNVTGSPLKTGYVALEVSPEKRRLHVAVAPRLKEARPGQTVPVDLTLTDAAGKPVRGEVTMWATDEGVLQLTGYQTPDVFAPVYRSHYLGVSTSSSLLRFTDDGYRDDGMGGDAAPGSDGQAAFRSRFLETAFFSKGVVTDARGRAKVDLPLPENITRWRLMATAADAGHRFGSAETSLTTKKPVQVSPSLPRFASVGDRLQAAVVVHNDTAAKGKATVNLSVSGVSLRGPSTQEVEVSAHGQAQVEFDVEATHATEARFRASVTLGQERDGFEIGIPVLAPTDQRTVEVFNGILDRETVLALSLPEDADPDTAELLVDSAPGEIAALGGALDALVDYPHGCTEQTTSRLIPMAQLEGLLSGHPVFEARQHRDRMQQAVVHLLGHQNANGGFGLWPETEAEGFLTAYALYGLELARERGLEVPAAAIDGAYRYLVHHDGNVEGYGYIGEGARKPFAAYVFQRGNRALPPGLQNLFEDESLTTLGRALLIAASPKAERSNAVLDAVLRKGSPSGHDGFYAGNEALHDDAGRVMALVAKGRLDAARSYVDDILRARTPSGGFGSTQDNLWALTALDAYYAETTTLAGHAVEARIESPASGEKAKGRVASLTLASTAAKPYARATVAVEGGERLVLRRSSGTTPGRLIARLAFNQQPESHQSVDAGFAVERRLYDHETGAPVGTLRVGQLVTVELRVDATEDTHQVAIVDRLPAGLEAVDLLLSTSAGENSDDSSSDDLYFAHQESHDERVSFFTNHLSSGSHVVRYVARATRRGHFVHPPPRVEAMYQADRHGIGALESVRVE